MAATSTLWASGTPTTSGTTWATTTNATGANNATFATWTSSTSGATGYINLSGYGAQTAIGSQPTSVDSVAVTVYHYENNTSRIPTVTVQLLNGTTLIGTAQAATVTTTTTNSQTFTFTGVTWAQLASLGVRVSATRAAVTQSAVFNVDAVRVVVNYTAAATTYPAAGTIPAVSATSGAAAVVPALVTHQAAGTAAASSGTVSAGSARATTAGLTPAASSTSGSASARAGTAGTATATAGATGAGALRATASGSTVGLATTGGAGSASLSAASSTDATSDTSGAASGVTGAAGVIEVTPVITGAATLNVGDSLVPALEFLTALSDSTDASTYTFAAVNIGTADPKRNIFVVLGARSTNAVGGVTIGGVTAARDVTSFSSGIGETDIWRAVVPTGTTADIVVTLSAGTRLNMAAYRSVGDVAKTAQATATTDAAALPVTVPAGGFAIAGSTVYASTATDAVWSVVTEDATVVSDGIVYTSAAHTETSGAISPAADWTVATGAPYSVIAAYSYAGAAGTTYQAAGTVAATSGSSGAAVATMRGAGTTAATSDTTSAASTVTGAAGTTAAVSDTSGAAAIVSGPVTYQAAGIVQAVSGTSGAAIIVGDFVATTPAARTFSVPAESRIFAVSAASRTHLVQ